LLRLRHLLPQLLAQQAGLLLQARRLLLRFRPPLLLRLRLLRLVARLALLALLLLLPLPLPRVGLLHGLLGLLPELLLPPLPLLLVLPLPLLLVLPLPLLLLLPLPRPRGLPRPLLLLLLPRALRNSGVKLREPGLGRRLRRHGRRRRRRCRIAPGRVVELTVLAVGAIAGPRVKGALFLARAPRRRPASTPCLHSHRGTGGPGCTNPR
jgi:hypothetical protein